MNSLFRYLGVASLLALSANSALATRVVGTVYCDANGNGLIEQQEDIVLAGVKVSALCLGATDTEEVPLPQCLDPNEVMGDITDEQGFYRIDVIQHTNLSYQVSLDGTGLPGDAAILQPAPLPAVFGFPLRFGDKFTDPQYIEPYRDGYTYSRPYIAKMDWLVASSECLDAEQPHITLVKEVSLNGGPFVDANTVETAPGGAVGSDAEYRLIVTNDGTEPLYNVVINDPVLNIENHLLAVNPLAPGQTVVITSGHFAMPLADDFDGEDSPDQEMIDALSVTDVCTSKGEYLNTASVNAMGQNSGENVQAQDVAYVVCEQPQIELRKQVSLDGINYVDADLADGADVPVGVVGQANAHYRFIVTNIGTETLTEIVVQDSVLAIDATISNLLPGESKVIESGEAGFGNLYKLDVCEGTTGNKLNVATVTAVGDLSKEAVSDSDPANLNCITGPAIEIKKQVRFANSDIFVDADTIETAPTAQLDGDLASRSAVYRFIVTNVGDEHLTNVSITDNKLNIVDVVIDDLPVGGKVVISQQTSGFENLFVEGQCDQVGHKENIAKVRADGVYTDISVMDKDVAFVNCEQPVECEISIDKTCSVIESSTDDKLCTEAISATTLRYTGPNLNNATVIFEGKDSGKAVYAKVNLESGVTILTKPSQNEYTIDAGAGNKLGSKTTITINGAEEIIHTSCSAIYVAGQPAPLDGNTPNPKNSEKGDPSPNWQVVKFRQKNDVVIAESNQTTEPSDSCLVPYNGASVTFGYKVKNTGSTSVDVSSILDDTLGEVLQDTPLVLSPGQSYTLSSDEIFIDKETVSAVFVSAHASGDTGVVCPAQDVVDISVEPAPQLSCEDGKPSKLGITYVGGSCDDSDHNQGGKSSCQGDSTHANPVRITLNDKKGNTYLSQVIESGDTVILDSAALGKSKLDSETNVYIEDGSGIIQSINFHTSCSAPLAVGDQHGGIVITSFVPEEGGKGKKPKHKDHKPKKGKDHKDKGKKDKKGKSDKKDKKGKKGKKGKH